MLSKPRFSASEHVEHVHALCLCVACPFWPEPLLLCRIVTVTREPPTNKMRCFTVIARQSTLNADRGQRVQGGSNQRPCDSGKKKILLLHVWSKTLFLFHTDPWNKTNPTARKWSIYTAKAVFLVFLTSRPFFVQKYLLTHKLWYKISTFLDVFTLWHCTQIFLCIGMIGCGCTENAKIRTNT